MPSADLQTLPASHLCLNEKDLTRHNGIMSNMRNPVDRVIQWLQRRKRARRNASLRRRIAAAEGDRSGVRRCETVADYLARAGYASATEYVSMFPRDSLMELARRLRMPRHRSWLLHWRLLDEAERAGAMQYCARSLFVRWMYNRSAIPALSDRNDIVARGGFLSPFDIAMGAVLRSLPAQYRSACYRVALGYGASNIPFDWIPRTADDAILVELFATYWPISSIRIRSHSIEQ